MLQGSLWKLIFSLWWFSWGTISVCHILQTLLHNKFYWTCLVGMEVMNITHCLALQTHNSSIKKKKPSSPPISSSLHHPPSRFQTSPSSRLLQPPSSSSSLDFPVARIPFLHVMQFGHTSACVICICTHYHHAQQMKNQPLSPPSLESSKTL